MPDMQIPATPQRFTVTEEDIRRAVKGLRDSRRQRLTPEQRTAEAEQETRIMSVLHQNKQR